MKFRLTFQIEPAAPFGLPQAGVIVLHASVGAEYVGDTYYTPTMTKAGHGTLPKYRPDEDALNEQIEIGGLSGQIRDNYVTLSVEANDRSAAIEQANKALDAFLQHLAVSMRLPFSARFLFGEAEDGQAFAAPPGFSLSVTHYNLEQLKTAVRDAERYASLQDQQLLRALQYFEHASWLFARRNQIADPGSRHFDFLIAAVFLNLWKAASSIVGDPTMDRDYQRRYRELGFDHTFFQDRIEKLRALRNEFDVAHYHLSSQRLSELEEKYGEATATVTEIIGRHRERLVAN
jgi:hypothetical protein